MKLFHVTNRRNVDSILERGLLTDWMGWDTGYVWGFDDEAIARESAAKDCWGGERAHHAVLVVDAAGLPVEPDPHPGFSDHRRAHSFAIPHSIEPERIEVLA